HQLLEVTLMNTGIGVDGHGAKFQALESLSAIANAFLLKERRPGRHQLDDQVDGRSDDRPRGCRDGDATKVQRPFPARDAGFRRANLGLLSGGWAIADWWNHLENRKMSDLPMES